MDPTTDQTLWGWTIAAAGALNASILWWYHVRRLDRKDKEGGDVSSSLRFVLTEMRAEIARAAAENTALRLRIVALESQNAHQRLELDSIRALTVANGAATDIMLNAQR